MAVYAFGDVQGCHDELQRLLERLNFDPDQDELWFTGDLVARGPKSLQTLRLLRELGKRVVSVLGNHDLHLLAIAEGIHSEKPRDALRQVLDAPDAGELLAWLRQRPLAHYDAQLGFLMVHAGLPPQWNLDTTLSCAREVERLLRGEDYRQLLQHMYGNEPAQWDPALAGPERARFIVNALTRMRFCTREGRLDFEHKGSPGSQPPELLPWFQVPQRKCAALDIVFGHWSTLGNARSPHAWALDTGCVWGGKLTALRLDGKERRWISVDCPAALAIGAE